MGKDDSSESRPPEKKEPRHDTSWYDKFFEVFRSDGDHHRRKARETRERKKGPLLPGMIPAE